MTPAELRLRTKRFAVDVIRFAKTLPLDSVTSVVARQLVRSSSSVGANYRASCRARSRADFIAKISIAEGEADETVFWLELLVEAGVVTEAAASPHLNEGEQLTRIFVASINTARGGPRGKQR